MLSPSPQYDHRAPEAKVVRIADNEAVAGNGGGGGGDGGGSIKKKSDDRVLLNWEKNSKMAKNKSPNLEGFNATNYIATGHKDTDSYKLNAFNQAESDKLLSDRTVPDTRNYK